MAVAREEIFGPVACLIKFRTEEEVIAMANDSDYGLGGAVVDPGHQPRHPGRPCMKALTHAIEGKAAITWIDT